ncbi:MAG: hypothetical protein HeimC2_11580 [Candidatus Heimdallarchaeota archaeon LC_2]|nr:MAG: hypothetical protein HeimC2_11580 [Candidatus Heimdallarchaeota archaeon LC_2]
MLIFNVIPIFIAMTLIIYDIYFQNKFDPYARIGAVLNENDREIFEKASNEQIRSFKKWSVIINSIMILAVPILVLIVEVDNSNSTFQFVQRRGVEAYSIMMFLLLFGYIIYQEARPVNLNSMIKVFESKGLNPKIVIDQTSDLHILQRVRNCEYYILTRSYHKKYNPNKLKIHGIIPINRSFLRKSKNGILDDNYLHDVFVKKGGRIINYLTNTFLTDLRITGIWPIKPRTQKIVNLSIIGFVISLGFVFFNIFFIHEDLVFWIGMIFVAIFIFILLFSYSNISHLRLRTVDTILTQNNIHINDMETLEKLDRLSDLIELKFPYVQL